jgi:NAD(P)-dependent dehydrogenase (short-subunit alcohol dehydrogenase family)
MLRFDGRTAIVTGAGRGMGRTHALLLAARGANVVVNDLGGAMDGTGADAGPAADVVAEIRAAGGNAVSETSSVATREGAEAIVAKAVEAFGGVDILVNNAGILTPHTFPDTGAEDLERNLAVHLGGSFNVTRAAWPQLQRSSAARVVLTTSCALFGSPFLIAYGAAKGGLYGLGRNLAAAGEEHGIKVNLISPYAKTRMADPDIDVNEGARTEVAAEEEGPTVFDRLLPEHASAVVAYLAHESCELTGEVLSCGGGRVARLFLAETQGFGATDVSPEDVAANIGQIRDERDYYVPEDITVYTTFFMERVPEEAAV